MRRFVKDLLLPVAVALALAFVIQAAVAKPYEIPTGSMYPTVELNDRIIANRVIYRLRSIDRGDIVVFEPTAGAAEPCPAAPDVPFVKRVIGLPGDTVEVRAARIDPDSPFPELRPGGALAVRRTGDADTNGLTETPLSSGEIPVTFVNGEPFVVPGALTPNYTSPDLSIGDTPERNLGPSGLSPETLRAITPEALGPRPGESVERWFARQRAWKVPPDGYFVLGDNRAESCDSHQWTVNGRNEPFVPRENILGQAEITYWPLGQAGFLD
jgi:signal peptidase I